MYDVSILYTVAVVSLVSVAIYAIDVPHAFSFFYKLLLKSSLYI